MQLTVEQQKQADAVKAKQEAVVAVEKAEKLKKEKEQAEMEAAQKLDAANKAILATHAPVIAKAQTDQKVVTKKEGLSEDEAWIATMGEKMLNKEHGQLTYANM